MDELVQKASDDFLAVEVAPDTTVDEEVKSQDLQLLKLKVQAEQFLKNGLQYDLIREIE